ncbi:hypothetical protein [Brevundimonas sp.]|uniref:hypothetical protein n=1 Tax=Brevundimonas sp. TaxID=1871086 RepID=UPI0035AE54D2
MVITLSADTTRRRIIVAVADGARERHLQAAIRTALADHPEWARWDWIIDDDGRLEDLTVEGLQAAAEAFRAAGSEGADALTAIVTSDRFFGEMAHLLDLSFSGRRHLAAPSLQAALALLDRLRGASDSPAATA